MAIVIRNLSLTLKLVLSVLFAILLVFEYFDGVSDVSDWATPFFFILMLNDYFVCKRLGSGKESEHWRLSSVQEGKRLFKYSKVIMNFFFAVILLISCAVEFSNLSNEWREVIFKSGFVLWTLFFLGLNIKSLIKNFNPARFVVTNIAFFLFIGSFLVVLA